VTFGIAESDENIPLLHETYPGNVHDANILPQIIDKLVDRLRNLKIDTTDMTVVFDKGNIQRIILIKFLKICTWSVL